MSYLNLDNVKNFFENKATDFCEFNFCKSIGKNVTWMKKSLGNMKCPTRTEALVLMLLSLTGLVGVVGVKNKDKIQATLDACKSKLLASIASIRAGSFLSSEFEDVSFSEEELKEIEGQEIKEDEERAANKLKEKQTKDVYVQALNRNSP